MYVKFYFERIMITVNFYQLPNDRFPKSDGIVAYHSTLPPHIISTELWVPSQTDWKKLFNLHSVVMKMQDALKMFTSTSTQTDLTYFVTLRQQLLSYDSDMIHFNNFDG